MSQAAVLSACQTPCRSGCPSGVRGGVYASAASDCACAAAGGAPNRQRQMAATTAGVDGVDGVDTMITLPLLRCELLALPRRHGGAGARGAGEEVAPVGGTSR